jgi:predicted Zn-dependent peptidase
LIDTGLAESVGMWAYEYQGTGIFMTYLACQPEDTEDNLQRLEAVYRQAESDGIDEDELVQAKSKVVSHLVLQAERPANRLFNVGNNWLQRREYKTLRDTIERYERVTCEEVAGVLSKYRLSQHTTVAVGPREDIRGVAAESLQ